MKLIPLFILTIFCSGLSDAYAGKYCESIAVGHKPLEGNQYRVECDGMRIDGDDLTQDEADKIEMREELVYEKIHDGTYEREDKERREKEAAQVEADYQKSLVSPPISY